MVARGLSAQRIQLLLEIGVTTLTVFTAVYLLYNRDFMGRQDASRQGKKVVDKLKRNITLNTHEEMIAGGIVFPEGLTSTFEDVGGLEEIVESIRETVLLPLQFSEVLSTKSSLLSAPKGMLLYGPPGCGKTLIAKAIAKEAGATFINIQVSTLHDKWFGESQKLSRAVFSLARKLQPAIIFIDEIDSFLRERRSNDHEVSSQMKSEFMTCWDGLVTEPNTRVMVVGATNRPHDLDEAILRRMPAQYRVKLPNKEQRKRILRILLKDEELDPKFDYESIADITENYSGSDLKELCRKGALLVLQEARRKYASNMKDIQLRALSHSDLILAKHQAATLGDADPYHKTARAWEAVRNLVPGSSIS